MKEQIIEFLKGQNMYEGVDETIIDELIKNINIASEALDEMGSNYTIESVTAAGSSTKVNPLFTVYNAALKNIQTLSTKLGLTPQDRAKLKLVKEDDGPGTELEMKGKLKQGKLFN